MTAILTVPNHTLRQVSQPLSAPGHRLHQLLRQLEQSLTKKNIGVGLAAPQLGISQRVFAVILPGKSPQYRYFINPQLTAVSPTQTLGEGEQPELEGCLSIPKVYAPIYRPTWIELTYDQLINNHFQTTTERFDGFAARIVNHEYDHLGGILFTDHALAQKTPLYYENARGELEKIDPASLRRLFGQY
jgi:peptide deformylase